VRTNLLITMLAVLICGTAQAQMPDAVRQTIDDHLIGSWTTVQDFDGKKTHGGLVNRWSPSETLVLVHATVVSPKGPVQINSIIFGARRISSLAFDPAMTTARSPHSTVSIR
jgi:hypothetical protein